jgi:osmotically-inducible protein OsmY
MNLNRIKYLAAVCCALLPASAVLTSGCSSSSTHRSAGTTMDDTVLAANIKADMYADPLVKGHEVSVKVYRGKVRITGFVDTSAQRERAEEIARHFPQVASVKNDLEIKFEPAGSER